VDKTLYIGLHSNFLLKHTKIEKSSYDIHGKTLFNKFRFVGM
jgi:hypothetical protein